MSYDTEYIVTNYITNYTEPFIIENGFYDLIHSKHNKLCIIDVDFKNVNNNIHYNYFIDIFKYINRAYKLNQIINEY